MIIKLMACLQLNVVVHYIATTQYLYTVAV